MVKSQWLVRGAVTVVVIGAAVLGYIAWLMFQPGPYDFAGGHRVDLVNYQGPSPVGVPPELREAGLVVRGEYITRMADCEACHTQKGGIPFAGGRAFKLPFGTIYTPNITSDRETGIGQWSDADFLRAIHKGIGKDGERLYPAFPYASYTLLTDADALAIKAYLFSLTPVKLVNKPNTFFFPFNQRWTMAIWSSLFNPDRRFQPIPEQSPEWNRGAYLVEAAGHCGECHSPRNFIQAMDQRHKFAGGAAEGWNAYNISSDPQSGVGDWNAKELEAYLAAGYSHGRGVASGPMAEAVAFSLSKLSSNDIRAIVTYMRSVPPSRTSLPATAGPAPGDPNHGPAANPIGKRIFEGNCASCHAWSGGAMMVPQAQLTGVRGVNDPTAANVVEMILSGSGPQSNGRAYMPSFEIAYSDTEVAAVANYVTARFGSKPSVVTSKDVARLREQN